MVHELKTCIPYWEQVFMGKKTFEVRKNDGCKMNYQLNLFNSKEAL